MMFAGHAYGELPYELSGGYGYGAHGRQKPHSLPPDFYGHSRIPETGDQDDGDLEHEDDDSGDFPSYRNGAPVNGRPQSGGIVGGAYGQGRHGGFARGGLYGSFDGGWYLGVLMESLVVAMRESDISVLLGWGWGGRGGGGALMEVW